ncbi:glycosyltransferase [Hyphomonas pacifica]|uniref:glycosyltransferase n=1 Tax=Hyphomonas pacifica TaxID=1280941 RepID=UPI001314F9BC|nr:glycosyltransferase [Hyphomonas pacifica]
MLSARHKESHDEIHEAFHDLIPQERIVFYQSFEHVSYQKSENLWRRKTSELLRDHLIASLEPDVVLFSSLVEGFEDNIVTSSSPLLEDAVRVAVAYDLIPLIDPKTYLGGDDVHEWYNEKMSYFRACHGLLAISASAGQEFVDLLGVNSSKIAKVPPAADSFAQIETGEGDFATLAARLKINSQYFTYAASYEGRKNFDGLLEAFAEFQKTAAVRHKLVLITSNSTPVAAAVRTITHQLKLDPADVILTGQVSDEELKLLYSNSKAMVYVSRHEGFGLPALEAMHCDAPVIGSNVSSIPEVIGLEEAMFDPCSTSDIAVHMSRIAEDKSYRERLLENGRERRELFTWMQSGEKAWSAFEKFLAQQPAKSRRSMKELYRQLITLVKAAPHASAPPTTSEWHHLTNFLAENLDAIESVPPRPAPKRQSWCIEGPFDSTYSLALLNRETARALNAAGERVLLHSSEGPGDYPPNEAFLEAAHGDVLRIWRDSSHDAPARPDVVSRNMYPPRVNDMVGVSRLLHHYAWEESRFPSEWADNFNTYLDGITCLSRHVQKALKDSGVFVPMRVSGCGVDHWECIDATEGLSLPGKSFRFLHVSSCFPRKGADALIKAYGKTFRDTDDVSLIIKTFPNPHNEIDRIIAEAKAADANFPEIIVLYDDFSDGDLKALYKHCHVLVAPSRAEGFGLPMAEAMLTGLPVITTGWGGQLDFCNSENAWLVDFSFAPAQTHFDLAASVWADPDVEDLSRCLRLAHDATAEERAAKARAGRDKLLKDHTWSKIVSRLQDAADNWRTLRMQRPPRMGMVTTWNCRCGIAAYSDYLISNIHAHQTVFGARNDELIARDGPNIVRCWDKIVPGSKFDDLEDLEAAVMQAKIECLVIQFNYYFYHYPAFVRLIEGLKAQGITIILIMHSTVDPDGDPSNRLSLIAGALSLCDTILVHTHHDLNRLKNIGLVSNTTVFPHGLIAGYPNEDIQRAPDQTFTLASFGYCLPHKGLRTLLHAFAKLARKDNRLRLKLINAEYPVDVSTALVAELREDIQTLGLQDKVEFEARFLPDEETLRRLNACDLIVFPYEKTGESSSAAVRFGIASGRPIARSKLSIFSDVENVTFPVDADDADILAASLEQLIADLRNNAPYVQDVQKALAIWRNDMSYPNIARRLVNMATAMHTSVSDE